MRKKLLILAIVIAGFGAGIWLYLKYPTLIGAGEDAEQVVLLHGLGRGESAVLLLENRLAKAGFEVHNIGYPSLRKPPEELLASVGKEIVACCADSGRTVHFVAHSLGDLLARAFLDDKPLAKPGRVVLLGTPNQGSELVNRFGDLWLFKALAGPTAQAIGSDADSLPKQIGPPYYPLGIIAGNSSGNPVSDHLLPGPNDGLVALENTPVPGMADFLIVDTGHAMMRYDAEVAGQVIYFLQHGRFSRNRAQ